jgi:chemotaxis protein CheD
VQLEPVTERQAVLYVEPGQLVVSAQPVLLRTILGSCVSVCLYDPGLRLGGMNHFMLPRDQSGGPGSFRYGEQAMSGLLDRVKQLGGEQRRLCAHVYGGAKVLVGPFPSNHLGQANVDFALDWLRSRGISVLSTGLLGTQARRLELDLASGTCSQRLLGGQ